MTDTKKLIVDDRKINNNKTGLKYAVSFQRVSNEPKIYFQKTRNNTSF